MKGLNIVEYNHPNAPRQFTHSLHHCGFVIVENAPICQQLMNQNYQIWQQFFQSDEKFSYPWCNHKGDGYISTAKSETAKGHHIKDLKEFFHVKSATTMPAYLNADVKQLLEQLSQCGHTFLSWIEQSLPTHVKVQLSEPLTDMIKDSSNTVMRAIHYPPLVGTEPNGAIRAAAHEDINLITVLPAATAEGLEVKDHSGAWHRLKLSENQLVVNTGDMIKEATNDYIRSTSHRVVNPDSHINQSRLSIPLFLHPRPDVILSKRYSAQALLSERLLENGFKAEKNGID
ncbi:isopenicillin N synthase family oxygenase [Gammaproteobacteria bacterium]|nr:isopenicillin N synthase family oxygenase [Gammaproteobacteria bacterium]